MDDMGFFDDEDLPDFNKEEVETVADLVLGNDVLQQKPMKEITMEEYRAGLNDVEIDWTLPWKARVPSYTWAALCLELGLLEKGFGVGQELEVGVDAVEFVLKAYAAKSSDLPSMMKHEEFKKCYEDALAQIEASGDNAGFVLRNRAVAEKALSVLAQQLTNGRVATKEVLAIYEATSNRGRLDPPKNEAVNSGLTLVFSTSDAVLPRIAEEDLPRLSVLGMKPTYNEHVDDEDVIEHEDD